ncbi:MAG: 16S rRNA (guanine(966)-N(2))-methyltransferase RsmD [Spirochaetae bacterium HGW-Spirochaetae-7]|nr:MAG: 16S rRNA (guanine(966)-N(2))-methyltransferase RsmD [Spirochaetae bacterium HGW-Spirochaetae-7]
MRVTGGTLRGRRIEVPQGAFEIRPAMDRMRESLFSILGPLHGRSFLDLFSGSGIIALEASSRGASPVACVERDRAKLSLLIRNVSMVPERIDCHCVPVERFILRCERSFSIVFCDAPFPYAHKADIVRSIAERGLVERGGLLLVHYPSEEKLPEHSGDLSLKDEREYGRSMVRFYERALSAIEGPDDTRQTLVQ